MSYFVISLGLLEATEKIIVEKQISIFPVKLTFLAKMAFFKNRPKKAIF